jgi:hypothetical protein
MGKKETVYKRKSGSTNYRKNLREPFELLWTSDEKRGQHVTRRKMNMNVDRGRGRSMKRWIDCVRQDMKEKDINDEMTTDRENR